MSKAGKKKQAILAEKGRSLYQSIHFRQIVNKGVFLYPLICEIFA